MKLSLLLLVVLVSTAFASPYYLRRQRGPGEQQKDQQQNVGSGKQDQGNKNGGKEDSDRPADKDGGKEDPDRKGKDACMKVLDDCMNEEETVVPAESGGNIKRGIEAMRRTAAELEAKADCKEYREKTQERKREEQTDATESTEEVEVDECGALLEKCMKPEEEGPAEAKRFLRLVARTEGGPCKEALDLGSEDGVDASGDGDDSNKGPTEVGDGQSPSDGQAARRNEIRQLLRDLYSRK